MKRNLRTRRIINYLEFDLLVPLPDLSFGLENLSIGDLEAVNRSNADIRGVGGSDVVIISVNTNPPKQRSSKKLGVLRIKNLGFLDNCDPSGKCKLLRKAIQTMEEASTNKQQVIVHCTEGINRSSGLVLAWALWNGAQAGATIEYIEKQKNKVSESWLTFDGESGTLLRDMIIKEFQS
jgi:hypothetical protein